MTKPLDLDVPGLDAQYQKARNILQEIRHTQTDLKAMAGFLYSEKPSSHLPCPIAQDVAKTIFERIREHVSDAELFQDGTKNVFSVYSPSSLEERLQREPALAAYLGIRNDPPLKIVEKSQTDSLVEGFALGFPASAILTWERTMEIQKKAPSFGDLLRDPERSKDWAVEDITLLNNLRARQKRIREMEIKKTSHSLFKLPNIRPNIIRLYKKYTSLTDDEIEFLLSVDRTDDPYMDYMISTQIETERILTREGLITVLGN